MSPRTKSSTETRSIFNPHARSSPMDPLSIASGAAGLAISCATIVKTLYTWIDDTVDVDENVSNLFEEVSILSRVLDSVSNASGRVPQAVVAEIDPGNALWGSISATLDDIKNTFNKLNQLMAELEKTSLFSRGLLRKPTKQIKFSLRSKDITIYKDRIKSYNTAMTSAFQMINVNSSQDSVFKVLSGLKSQLRHVEFVLHTRSSASPGPSSGREEDDRATQNLRQFVQVAENFHSSASTILREGPRSTVWGGSIMGDPLTEAQTSMIERWIPPPVNEESRSPVDADSDSETVFARRIEELAIKNEADGDHAKAEQFYRGAIEHGESSSRPKKWTEADEVITPIAFERKTNDILVYHGMHALALAYLDDSKLEEAEKYCKRALWGKRKVLGKDHLSCWETLTLLVSICTARNKMMEAEVHRSFIPNYETIAIDPEALTYLDRSVGSLGRPSNDSDMVPQTQQPLAFQQEYPPSQPYTTAASGPVPSPGSFRYPKTFGSQYTSPPTPNSHQGMVQYPTQHMQTRPNSNREEAPIYHIATITPYLNSDYWMLSILTGVTTLARVFEPEVGTIILSKRTSSSS
uniref:Azaphilone pigments biosynthesis cluster protein L N-terminal domain-containing protein n=1 Tax=Fusarium oxysporum (strain Fo5176) TaxID=660025 RepID=A0A0D2XIW2_FUSOF